MLFDLRGRGRRRTVQVIYLSLAVLMGGGLVLFGIGGATSGGLIDAVSGSGSSNGSGTATYEKKVTSFSKQVKLNPKDAVAWAGLAKAQVQRASVIGYDQNTGTYNDKGIAGLQLASTAWKRYLDLNPKKADDSAASLMVGAYSSSGLNQPKDAADALEQVIEGRGASDALYTQLAVTAYLAGDVRRSVLAERRAVELTPKASRTITKARIAAQRKQIDKAKLQAASQQAGGTSTGSNGLGGG